MKSQLSALIVCIRKNSPAVTLSLGISQLSCNYNQINDKLFDIKYDTYDKIDVK